MGGGIYVFSKPKNYSLVYIRLPKSQEKKTFACGRDLPSPIPSSPLPDLRLQRVQNWKGLDFAEIIEVHRSLVKTVVSVQKK